MFEDFEIIINRAIDKYIDCLLSDLNKKQNIKLCSIDMVSEYSFNDKTFNQSDWKQAINILKIMHLIYEFTDELLFSYITFKLAKYDTKFTKVMEIIKKQIKIAEKKLPASCVRKIKNINICENLGTISLAEYYTLFESIKKKKIIPYNNNKINIYEYFDMLNYEDHSFQVLNKQSKDKIYPIINKENFFALFHKLTDNVFVDFDYTNACIAGGFVFSLLTNTIIDSTDIDIFIYGTEEEIAAKMKYILNYFQPLSPYYAVNRSVVTIISSKMMFDIQIIPYKDNTSAFGVINKFDLSHCMIYFDGLNIWANLHAFASLKYRVTKKVFKKETNKIRYYKSIKKGLEIMGTDDEILKFDETQYQNMMLKSKTIRKFLASSTPDEALFTLKSFYRTSKIFQDANAVTFNTDFEPDDYNKISNTRTIVKRKMLDLEKCSLIPQKMSNNHRAYWYFIQGENCKTINYRIYFEKCPIVKIENSTIHVIVNNNIINELNMLRNFFMTNVKKVNGVHILYNSNLNIIKLHCDDYISRNNIGRLSEIMNDASKITAECRIIIYNFPAYGGIHSPFCSGFKMVVTKLQIFNQQLVLTNDLVNTKPVIIDDYGKKSSSERKKLVMKDDSSESCEDEPEDRNDVIEKSSEEEEFITIRDVKATFKDTVSSSSSDEEPVKSTIRRDRKKYETSSEESEDLTPPKKNTIRNKKIAR